MAGVTLMVSGGIGVKSGTDGRQKFNFFIAKVNRDDLRTLSGLIKAGKIAPIIDRRYPLIETGVAIAYVEQGHAPAKVVIMFQ